MKAIKRVVAISILAISIVFALASNTIAYADHGGTAYWNDPVYGWVVIPPSPNHLDLDPSVLPIEIKICDIPDMVFGDPPQSILVQYKVSNEDDWRGPDEISKGDCIGPFDWPISPYEICQTNIVQWRVVIPWNDDYKPDGPEYTASGIIGAVKPAHIHIIPEFPFGTAMSLLPLLSGLVLYAKFRKK